MIGHVWGRERALQGSQQLLDICYVAGIGLFNNNFGTCSFPAEIRKYVQEEWADNHTSKKSIDENHLLLYVGL